MQSQFRALRHHQGIRRAGQIIAVQVGRDQKSDESLTRGPECQQTSPQALERRQPRPEVAYGDDDALDLRIVSQQSQAFAPQLQALLRWAEATLQPAAPALWA